MPVSLICVHKAQTGDFMNVFSIVAVAICLVVGIVIFIGLWK